MRFVLQTTLTIVLISLGAAVPAIAVSDPTGNGPPDSKSCRRSDPSLGSTIPGPTVCLTNAQWIALHAKKMTISPDGKSMVSSKYYNVQDHYMTDDRDMTPRGGVVPGTP